MKPVYMLGTGSYLPEKVLSNDDLSKMMDTSDEWIMKRTGIRERRMARPDQASSDLALLASRAALDESGLTAQDMDLIIMPTLTPDMCCPCGANYLQAKLDAPQALTFDITAACSGFVFGMLVAKQFIQNGHSTHALIAAAEIITRVVDYTNRSNAILWGDGSGAAVLSATNPQGKGHEILFVNGHSDGANGQSITLPGGGSLTTPITHESVEAKKHTVLLIDASNSLRVAVNHFAESCHEALNATGYGLEDVDWFVPHQANIRIIQALSKKLGVGMDRFYMTIEKYGNTSAPSVAYSLDEAARTGAIKRGQLVMLTVFGGGLTWASALIRW